MSNNHELTREVRHLVISRHLIVDVQPHPEEYGDFIAILDNDMCTDVYKTDAGEYVTITNDKKLIDYVDKKNKGERNMKKYVKIQSTRNIQVTGGLEYLDMTDDKAAIPNKIKVQPLWSKEKLVIKVGTAWYPSYVTKWPTTQALNKDGIITIGEFADKLPESVTADESREVLEHETKLEQAKMEIERQKQANNKHKSIKAGTEDEEPKEKKRLKDIVLGDKE